LIRLTRIEQGIVIAGIVVIAVVSEGASFADVFRPLALLAVAAAAWLIASSTRRRR
jgi:hypothetical protein